MKELIPQKSTAACHSATTATWIPMMMLLSRRLRAFAPSLALSSLCAAQVNEGGWLGHGELPCSRNCLQS
jgi:hypothetical protein